MHASSTETGRQVPATATAFMLMTAGKGTGSRDAEPKQAHLASASVLCWARTRPQVGRASAVMMRDVILSCMKRISACDPAFASKARKRVIQRMLLVLHSPLALSLCL